MPNISQHSERKNRFYSYHKAVTHDHRHKILLNSDKQQLEYRVAFCAKQSRTLHFIYLANDDSESY